MLHLGALTRYGAKLVVNTEDPTVSALMHESPNELALSPTAKEAFATLVLRNRECRAQFFDLFVPGDNYDLTRFRSHGTSVTWQRDSNGEQKTAVVLKNTAHKPRVLATPSEINSILYGVRYWARDELDLLDEFFRDDRGTVMYTLDNVSEHDATSAIITGIVSSVSNNNAWTTFSVSDLIVKFCEEHHRPIRTLFNAIGELTARHAGDVVLIPVSRQFATLTARSPGRESLDLRGYYCDNLGRFVSHIRIFHHVGRTEHAAIA